MRIGSKPYKFKISRYEGLDIDTDLDFKYAEMIGNPLDINSIFQLK